MRQRWNDPLYPERRVILERMGPLTDKVVLCLGNGTSTKELYFASLGARVICSDISLNGVLALRNRYSPSSLPGSAEFHAIDAYHLPFKTDTIDIVYGYEFVHHLAELPCFLRELYRVLKPGGITTFFECGYSAIWQTLKKTVLRPLMMLSHLLHPRSQIDIRGSYSGGFKEENLKQLLRQHGFTDFYCRRTTLFQYALVRGIGSVVGWRLPTFVYRVAGALGRFLDGQITARSRMLDRNRIEMVWGFRKPAQPPSWANACWPFP